MKCPRALLFAAFLTGLSAAADAACSNPAGMEGQSVYNDTYHVPTYCNNSQWVAYGLPNAAGGGGCTNPVDVERKVTYNTTSHVLQYCDGATWRKAQGACAS